jgi:hypothetical protein
VNEDTAPRSAIEMPDTDDPVVLRELLRQSREQLQMRESIEQMMARSAVRTEALLTQVRGASPPAETVDAKDLREGIATLRATLRQAMETTDDLESRLPPAPQAVADGEPVTADKPSGPRTVEVLVQPVASPKVARSLQHYLADLDHVSRAEVRELAEGMLRISVTASAPLTGDLLAGWEPERARTVHTQRTDVLEIELAG